MATTIANTLPAVCFTGNPVEVTINTDNCVIQTGTYALWSMRFTADPVDGDFFILDIPGLEEPLTFTFRTAPALNALELPTNMGGDFMDDYLDQVAEFIGRNEHLYQNYVIAVVNATQTEGDLQLEAREVGADWTVNADDTGMASGAGGEWVDVAGTDRSIREQFQILLDLYAKVDGSFQRLVRLEYEMLDNGLVTADIAKALEGVLEGQPPSYTQATLVQLTASITPFYLRHGERFGATPATQSLLTSPVGGGNYHTAALGGLNKKNTRPLWNHIIGGHKFLSWYPGEKPVTEEQPDYLYYIVQDGAITGLHLQVEVTFDDGTTATSRLMSQTPVSHLEGYIFPAGFSQLFLATIDPAKTVLSYKLWLEDQNDTGITEERVYVLDRKPRTHTRYLCFRNSLGGYETLLLTGAQATEAEVDRTEFISTPPNGEVPTDRRHHQYDHRLQQRMTVGSGYLPSAEVREWMQEVFLSPDVLIADPAEQRWLPVNVTGNEIPLGEDGEGVYAVEIEYEYAWQDRHYAPQL